MAMLLDSFQKVNQFEEMVAMHMQLLSIHGLYPISISTHYHCFIKQTTMKRELGKNYFRKVLKSEISFLYDINYASFFTHSICSFGIYLKCLTTSLVFHEISQNQTFCHLQVQVLLLKLSKLFYIYKLVQMINFVIR